MTRIAVLVSGGGTNLQALLDAQRQGDLGSGKICLVVSSRPGVFALERAQNSGVEAIVTERKKYPTQQEYDAALLHELETRGIELVVLAGFLSILGSDLVRHYERRILNVHPSLIPSFCGQGCYGLKVHQAALSYGVKLTGATVHFVSEVVDGGKILLQKAVEVRDSDTPETLQQRVMEEAEWQILPRAVAMVCAEIDSKKE